MAGAPKTPYSIRPLPASFARRRLAWRLRWGAASFLLYLAALLLDEYGVSMFVVGPALLAAFLCFGVGFLWSFNKLHVNGKVLTMEVVDEFFPHRTDICGFIDHDEHIVYVSRFL